MKMQINWSINNTKVLLVCLFLSVAFTSLAYPPKGKSAKSSRGEHKKMNKLLNGDLFLGPAFVRTQGDFLEYQTQYYFTGTSQLPAAGTFNQRMTIFQKGAQLRVAPFYNEKGALSWLSFGIGFMNNRKGFSHEFSIQNRMVNYSDITVVNEKYRADYLSIPISLRFGNRIYADLGVCFDNLLSGEMNQTIVRETREANVGGASVQPFKPAFSTSAQYNYSLTSKVMKSTVTGVVFGAGAHITKNVGLRLFAHSNNGFFSQEPNLRQFVFSTQAIFTIN
jgi:hypothetical protein